MATREENLKKINEELEKLSDDELEKVAGGILVRKIPIISVFNQKKEPDVNIEKQSRLIVML